MVFYQKYKPIPKLGQKELEKHWREVFENEGTMAANAWAENHFDDYTGLKVNEYLPRLRALCRAWNGVFWMNYFPADLRLAPKSTKAWRILLANEARNAGISFDGGHGQHPRWLVGGGKDNAEANAIMSALAADLEKRIRAVPDRFDVDLKWKKMKSVLFFKRRTLLYVVKDQLVIEYHKEHDNVKRPLKVVR